MNKSLPDAMFDLKPNTLHDTLAADNGTLSRALPALDRPDTTAIFTAVLMAILSVLGTAANTVLLLAFCRRPALRTNANRLVLNENYQLQ